MKVWLKLKRNEKRDNDIYIKVRKIDRFRVGSMGISLRINKYLERECHIFRDSRLGRGN